MSHDIFISHASKDRALAEKLVDVLLNNGCDVTSDRILCTSLEGMGIPAGSDNFIEFLRDKIQNPKLVVLLLTQNYFDSVFCVCELGATWGMDLSYFPITVAPISKSNMPGTLKVSQAGDILDKSYLDELRDIVKDALHVEVKTARWNIKRDEFLKLAPEIIDALDEPEQVDKAILNEVNENYAAALEEIKTYSEEISELRARLKETEACRDAEEVRNIRKKYTDEHEQFKQLCSDAKQPVEELEWATIQCLYWHMRDEGWAPEREDSEYAKQAEAKDEIVYDYDVSRCHINPDHPRVTTAIDALRELGGFIDRHTEEDSTFIEDLRDENQFPISLTNKDFWSQFLVPV